VTTSLLSAMRYRYKGSEPLLDPGVYPRLRQLGAGQRLELRQARLDDEAVYKCQAYNAAGQTVKRFKLKLLGMLLSRFVLPWLVSK